MTYKRMFYGLLLGYAVGLVLVLGFGWQEVWWSTLGGVGAIIGGLSAVGVPDFLRPRVCPLAIAEEDGSETYCFWYSGHKGRCSFEAPCAGYTDAECRKHYGHDGRCTCAPGYEARRLKNLGVAMTTADSNMWDVALRVVGEAHCKALEEDKGWRELEDAKRLIAFYRDTPMLVFYKQAGHWLFDGFAVLPVIEKLQGERSRLVLETSDFVAEDIRHKFGLMRIPAPLDATEAIVRATHSLASATDKLSDVLDKLATQTVVKG